VSQKVGLFRSVANQTVATAALVFLLNHKNKIPSVSAARPYQQPAAPAKYPANRLFTSTSDGCLRTFLLFIFISYRFLVAQIDN
jgi:hypothetical protein